MKIVTTKEENAVIQAGKSLTYDGANNPVIEEEDGRKVAYACEVNIYDVETIPDDYIERKYCYETEKGFYSNPDYQDPSEKRYTLDEAAAIIASEVAGNE